MKLEDATKEELIWWIKEHAFALSLRPSEFEADIMRRRHDVYMERADRCGERYTKSEKAEFRRRYRSAVCRSPVDRLELCLALFGFEGTHYECSFDDAHLPARFGGVRKVLSAFFKRCKRWRHNRAFDYVYAIEYGTQHCRYPEFYLPGIGEHGGPGHGVFDGQL